MKQSYRFARRNVMLRNWTFALFLAVVGLVALGTFGLLTIRASVDSYNSQVSSLQAELKRDKLDQTQKEVQDMSNSLKLAVQVLSQEVLFSKLITQIGAAMPSGTTLTGLNINGVSGGIALTANATSYTTATQAQVNLSDPSNKIFAKVDIENITCTPGGSNDPQYPCTVQMRALFNTNNPFLFIHQGAK